MEFALKFNKESSVIKQENGFLVFLSSSLQEKSNPEVFRGELKYPLIFRNLLLTLHDVVDSKFYKPDSWKYMDPIITLGSQKIRMESFSSCASVYGRVDIFPEAFESANFFRQGTANFDFNNKFIQALSVLKPDKKAVFKIGEESVPLETEPEKTIERKIKLSERWVKGFLQLQAIQTKTIQLFEIDKLTAGQIIDSIPSVSHQSELYIVPTRGKPQILYRKPLVKDGYISVSGANRLKLLTKILPDIELLKIYQKPDTGSMIWSVDTKYSRFSLTISGNESNGFSGNADTLKNISNFEEEFDFPVLNSMAKSLNNFTLDEFAESLEVQLNRAVEIVDKLFIQGTLGYDRSKEQYFYRVLPFMDSDSKLAPKPLKDSKKIIDNHEVEIEKHSKNQKGMFSEGWVKGRDALYHVSIVVDESGFLKDGKCTCKWILKHGLKRGPCKHMLSLRFAVDD